MRSLRPAIVALGLAAAFGACGGEIEREHTATTVRGSYGDPPAYDPCPPDPNDGGADADAADTGTPDGC